MRYTRIERETREAIITIGEYIQATQPAVWAELTARTICEMAINSIIIVAERLQDIARIMRERPKPGRGGLLPGEREGVLYE